MKLRTTSLLAATYSALTLTLGTNAAVGAGAPRGLTAIGEWTITTTDAQGHTVQFGDLPGDAPDSSAEQQPSAMAAAGPWRDGQCGSNSSTANKLHALKQYNRPKVHDRMEGSKAKMYCGKSVGTVISEPGWRTVQNADRYCYQKRFGFRSPNGSTFDRQVIVILGRTGVRIMTAFPSTNSDYCQGTRI